MKLADTFRIVNAPLSLGPWLISEVLREMPSKAYKQLHLLCCHDTAVISGTAMLLLEDLVDMPVIMLNCPLAKLTYYVVDVMCFLIGLLL